jgi:integrase
VAAGYDSSRLTAHSLRHTAVTLSLLGGKSLQEVQQFARHTNIATTQIYAHNLDRAKNNCEEVVAKAIF